MGKEKEDKRAVELSCLRRAGGELSLTDLGDTPKS